MIKKDSFVRIVFMTVILMIPLRFASASASQNQTPVIELSGTQLRACAVALEDFQTRGYLLDHYKIVVTTRRAEIEVVFVPNQPTGFSTVRGGSTIYGKEIHYLVSLTGDIEKVSYAR